MKTLKLSTFTKQLLKEGRHSFTKKEAMAAMGCSSQSFINAANRLSDKKELALVTRGFYIIIPPQYYDLGALPAEWFIDDLMSHFRQPYYVGLLSAASHYGATHQQPQRLQVITNKQIRPISIGRISIEFIVKNNIPVHGVNQKNTYTGTINVSSPELTMLDICEYPAHAGYIHNMAQVVSDLGAAVKQQSLTLLIDKISVKTTILQRLGYLLDFTMHEPISKVLLKALSQKKTVKYILLSPSEKSDIIEKNKKWHIYINESVELDL